MPTIVCTQCGKPNDASATRCAQCGSALSSDETRIEDAGGRVKELRRLQYELFQATERADAAELRLQQAAGARIWAWVGVAVALAGIAGAFLGGMWLGRGGSVDPVADAKVVAALRSQVAEQARKIEELRAATVAKDAAAAREQGAGAPSAPPPAAPEPRAPASDALPGPAPVPPAQVPPSPPSPEVPGPAAVPPLPRSPSSPSSEAPASPALPRSAASAMREGTLTWEGELRDLVAMASNKPLTIRIDGAQATTDPETRAGRLEGELPGVPVSIEAVDPGVVVVEAPDASSRWKRIVLRVDSKGGGDRRSLHLKASVRWVVS